MAGCAEWQNFQEVLPMDVSEANKKRAREFVELLKKKVRKANLVAVEALDGERKQFSGAAAATETAIDKIQMEKMDKCAESDDPRAGVNGKHLLPDDYVNLVLAMPKETPIDPEDFSFITNLGKLLNESDDWIEKQKQRHTKRAALKNRINGQFVQFQDSVRDKWINQGYVEVEEEVDYEANLAKVNAFASQLWKKNNDFSGLV